MEVDSPCLPIHDLHIRHYGLTPELSGAYLQAACVSLDRFHVPPERFTISDEGVETTVQVLWQPSEDRAKAAWNNEDDATRDGAYACAIAAAELVRECFAVRRAETRTGADYYIAPTSDPPDDLENCYRLEVSGTSAGDRSVVKTRVNMKVAQARAGHSNLPAVAAVVGFNAKLIIIRTVGDVP